MIANSFNIDEMDLPAASNDTTSGLVLVDKHTGVKKAFLPLFCIVLK